MLYNVSSGVSLTEALRQYSKKYVPRLVLQLVQVGEQSDKLQENLAQLATHYTQSFQRRTDGMIKLIEPLLLLVVGGVMAVFIIGLFYPLYQQMGVMLSSA